jgi:DNA-binding Lrp family transcriptional regulator
MEKSHLGRKLFYGEGCFSKTVKDMVIGFILISTAPAKEHDVFKTLMNVSEIVELHPLFGEYDLIAKIEARDFNTLGQIVVEKVRSIPGVIDTKTLTGIKFS